MLVGMKRNEQIGIVILRHFGACREREIFIAAARQNDVVTEFDQHHFEGARRGQGDVLFIGSVFGDRPRVGAAMAGIDNDQQGFC